MNQSTICRKLRAYFHFDRRVLATAILAGLPGILLGLILLWSGDYSTKVQLTFTLLVVGGWLSFAASQRERITYSLRTVSNLLAALREGDYSLRAQHPRDLDSLGEVLLEINALGDILQKQRLGAVEASALLRKVMDEIEVAVLAFDGEEKLRMVNRHAERLLGEPAERLLGRQAAELGLNECLQGEAPRVLNAAFPGGGGRWELRRGQYREQGLPCQLVVLSDLTRALREEERQAWQRLVQVLRHEINNSLAPIHSLSESLRMLMTRSPRTPDWESDLLEGLSVIADRAKALNRFMVSYAQVTRLPKPKLQSVEVGEWVRRVVNLETRMETEVLSGPALTIQADGDQLDQLLINLVKNAVDAALETKGTAQVRWEKIARPAPALEVLVEDEGPGMPNTANLFVPFFTTKPQGSGLGLMLSRQIAEAHGGTLTLENRSDQKGCRARLRLPCG